MDLQTIRLVLDELIEEKGISKEKVIESIEMALAAAYKRDYGEKGQVIRAEFNIESGRITFKQVKTVVDQSMLKSEEEEEKETDYKSVNTEKEGGDEEDPDEIRRVRFNPERHIMIDEAIKIKKGVEIEQELEFPLKVKKDYGRIAAQTAKQVIIQRIREAEREAIWNEFKDKEGEVISGIVQRIEGRNVFIDLGRATAVLPHEEQVPHERYRIGERIKALLLSAEKSTRGSGIYLSRSHPHFVTKLFEIEVPEIPQGTVEIKSIAREAGSRSKIAVISHEENIDPVGSLVGQKGVRVSTVISELGGEKIDIIEWSEDYEKFIANALSPAKILSVDINNSKNEATVIVDESQLSLAIGRGGQNVRLAAKLSNWKIDVKSQTGESIISSKDQDEEEDDEYIKESNNSAVVKSSKEENEGADTQNKAPEEKNKETKKDNRK